MSVVVENQEVDSLRALVSSIYSMQSRPTAEDFATMLGFSEPVEKTRLFANLSEVFKLVAVCHLLRRLRMNPNPKEENIVYNKLAALHLPALVNNFVDPPPVPETVTDDAKTDFRLNNVYLETLGTLSHTPYFYKFLRSRKPIAANGKRLLQIVAERLVEVAPSWDYKMINTPIDREPGYYQSAAGTAIQMISTLSAAFVDEPLDSPILISEATKQTLLTWLKKWERRHPSEFISRVSERTRGQLERRPSSIQDANRVRRVLKNWDVCGMPGCQNESDLKACSRCQTTRYCCTEHQRAHWVDSQGAHKKLCFTVDY